MIKSSQLMIFKSLLFSFVLISCKQQNKTSLNIIAPISRSEIMDMNHNQLIDKYGKPKYDFNFKLTQNTLLEYRANLGNIYPNYGTENINLEEMDWNDGNHRLIIWLKLDEGSSKVIDFLYLEGKVQF